MSWTERTSIGYFGASTGSAGALIAAATLGDRVGAVVSRGGRPDLAPPEQLARVSAPTVLIVGENDDLVVELNRRALALLPGTRQLTVVPCASHLFEEPGTLEEASRLATGWFSATSSRRRDSLARAGILRTAARTVFRFAERLQTARRFLMTDWVTAQARLNKAPLRCRLFADRAGGSRLCAAPRDLHTETFWRPSNGAVRDGAS